MSPSGAVIIGSGPSLRDVDMRLLAGRTTIAFNRSYIAWREWGFDPTYYACIDRNSLIDCAADLRELVGRARTRRFFLRDAYVDPALAAAERVEWIRCSNQMRFSTDLRSLGRYWNVAAVSVQILAALGHTRVVLVGVDGEFAPHATAVALDEPWNLQSRGDDDPNHFTPAYHGAGRRFTRPNPEKFRKGWDALAAQLPAAGVEVVNASTRTALTQFPRLPLREALQWQDSR
ncbi:MAG TPA: hypothetical protein VJT67_14835 [Longimicrobiaceae bacterium]|nr:hypothetical protein [Longimicrobiaceae bacterium]